MKQVYVRKHNVLEAMYKDICLGIYIRDSGVVVSLLLHIPHCNLVFGLLRLSDFTLFRVLFEQIAFKTTVVKISVKEKWASARASA